MERIKAGVIGCGNISGAYFNAAKIFNMMEISSCADINPEASKAKAEEFGIKAVTVDELLTDPEIQIVINLTLPQTHAEMNLRALAAGKHAHCEKPFAVTREEAREVLDLAKEKNLLTGCAPDTFLGAGQQTARKLIDDGWIGRPIAGTAFMMCPGHERWHPNPGFYYIQGGGPMLDMGPYYITALVNLLGPAKRVCCCAGKGFNERVATSEALYGKKFPVTIDTHVAGTIEFHDGAIITLVMSFDVCKHSCHNIEIHGTDGSMQVPDPNSFSGPVKLFKPGNEAWLEMPLTSGYTDNMRSIGAADIARAIQTDGKNRCSGDLANHVLDIMLAFIESSNKGEHVTLNSTCERPEPLPSGLLRGEL